MRYYRLLGADGEPSLAVEADPGVLSSLTSVDEDLIEIEDLAMAASMSGLEIDDLAIKVLDLGDLETYALSKVMGDSRARTGDVRLDRPFEPPEVWAAGLTYKISEGERRRESSTPDIYSKIYSAQRPELFLKATSDRCVGPFEPVGIRGDSDWNVPEPELAFVIYKGKIIGYTAGNDMSSRSIEGENPLYLSQAKVFDRCCSIGPCFVTALSFEDPHSLKIRCSINRDGQEVFYGEASTSQMTRSCDDLAYWLQRHNSVLNMTTVLTGTAIVPPPDFSLEEGDVVEVAIEGIGTLENEVTVV